MGSKKKDEDKDLKTEEKVNDSSYEDEEKDSEVEDDAMTKFLLAAQQEDFRFSTVTL